jgi:hypothetical protein
MRGIDIRCARPTLRCDRFAPRDLAHAVACRRPAVAAGKEKIVSPPRWALVACANAGPTIFTWPAPP